MYLKEIVWEHIKRTHLVLIGKWFKLLQTYKRHFWVHKIQWISWLEIKCSVFFTIVALLCISVMQSKLDTKMGFSVHLLAFKYNKRKIKFYYSDIKLNMFLPTLNVYTKTVNNLKHNWNNPFQFKPNSFFKFINKHNY
jgi:hypothetical protein